MKSCPLLKILFFKELVWLFILCCPLSICSSNDIPLKECLAYGEGEVLQRVRGGGGEEEAHIYDAHIYQLPGGEDDGVYEN